MLSLQTAEIRSGPPLPSPSDATANNFFITIKRRPNFLIINYSFNFCSSLKAKSILEVSKIYKGSQAYYLALNVDIIEVFVLGKPSWQFL